MNRWLKTAYRMATKSTHPHHKMGAVVVRGGAVLSSAANLGSWGRHAEVRALRPHTDYTGATVYVVRLNGRVSEPCEVCKETLERAGVKEVVYIDEDRRECRKRLKRYDLD